MTRPASRQCQPGVDAGAPVLCYYADNPARRPGCTLTAVILHGRTPLCGPCAQARSTVGKGLAAVNLPPSPELDVLDWIAQADATIRQAQRHLAAAVTRARQNGRSWAEIADRLGITRQAAQQRFGNDPLMRG